jgi:hypothetical protein
LLTRTGSSMSLGRVGCFGVLPVAGLDLPLAGLLTGLMGKQR